MHTHAKAVYILLDVCMCRFPNNSSSAFSQAHEQSSVGAQAEESNTQRKTAHVTRRRSSIQMQRTPPPAPAPQQRQQEEQPAESQHQTVVQPAQPSKLSTPLPPLHPSSFFTSPSGFTPPTPVISSALKIARERLSHSGNNSREVSPKENSLPQQLVFTPQGQTPTNQTPQSQRLGGDYMSPLRFPGDENEPAPLTPASHAKFLPPSTGKKPAVSRLSASPLAVSLAPNVAHQVDTQSAVPLASFSTPARPVLLNPSSRRQSHDPVSYTHLTLPTKRIV